LEVILVDMVTSRVAALHARVVCPAVFGREVVMLCAEVQKV
jgi:hypothetical protein